MIPITGYFIQTFLNTVHHVSMDLGVPGPGLVKCLLLLIVQVDIIIRKSVQGQIIMENVKRKQKKDISVSFKNFFYCVLFYLHSGDPTLKQKAKILIAELDLHKSSSNSGPTTSVRLSSLIYTPKGLPIPAPFCPKPIGERICNTKKSKH